MGNKNKPTSATPKFSMASVLEAGKAPLLIIGGMVAGNYAAMMANKALKIDETTEGETVKKAIVPLVLIGTGVAGSVFLKNNNLKLVMAGVAGAGLHQGIKVFLKKDIMNLAGIDDLINGLKGFGENQTMLAIEDYLPNLPKLNGEDDDREVGNIEIQDSMEGIDGSYQEVEIVN